MSEEFERVKETARQDERVWVTPPGEGDLHLVVRRSFLGWLLGIGTATIGVLLSVPLFRFAIHPIVSATTETSWSDLGPADDFMSLVAPKKCVITVNQLDGWRKVVQEKSVYVVRDNTNKLRVLSSTCPHLGCSIRFNDTSHQFGCPCHNGSFTADGKLLSGPPPRSMDDLDSRIADGRLQVKYQSFRQLVPTKEVLS